MSSHNDRFSFYVALVILIGALSVKCQGKVHRKLSYDLDLSCDPTLDASYGNELLSLNLVHVTADGQNDSIHYVWSTYGYPTVLIAQTSLNVSLHLNCSGLQRFALGSISFSELPQYSAALILDELWEFIDSDDTVKMSPKTNITRYSASDFIWNSINDSLVFSEDLISASAEANTTDDLFRTGGTLKVQFAVSANKETSSKYPHLWFNGNSCEMTLYLLGLNVNDAKSRFAVHLTAITSLFEPDLKWNMKDDDTMNDENSPGVFSVKNVLYPCPSGNDSCKGYVSWKPVAYIGSKPTVANSSDARSSPLNTNASYPMSIATAFFGKVPQSVVSWNMTFGTSRDGFYMAANYTSWSLMMGLGDPVTDSLSILAIVVITVGLGAPLLIFAAGLGYMGYKRFRKNDDDLLLEG